MASGICRAWPLQNIEKLRRVMKEDLNRAMELPDHVREGQITVKREPQIGQRPMPNDKDAVVFDQVRVQTHRVCCMVCQEHVVGTPETACSHDIKPAWVQG